MNDNELLAKIKCKDEAAFNELIEKYISLFYAIIQQVFDNEGTKEDIVDCLSESLIYIWNNIKKCNISKCSLRNWCCFIVMNRAKNYIQKIQKHNKKEEKYIEISRDRLPYNISAEDEYLEKWAIENIFQRLKIFPEAAQKVFIYRYFCGMKPREISQKMNITTKQADNYLTYIKNKLKKTDLNDFF